MFHFLFLKDWILYGGFLFDIVNLVKLLVIATLEWKTVLRKPTFVLEIIFTLLSLVLGGWEIFFLGADEPSLTMQILNGVFCVLKFSLGELP